MIATIIALLFSSGALGAQPAVQAPLDPSTSVVVQELEVIARPRGPALWKVQRGASTVFLLGAVTPLPHMLEWNTIRLERALDGANLVLLPPQGRPGVFDVLNIFFHAGDARLPRGGSLYDLMTTDEKAKFENLRVQAKTDAKRYAPLKPALAGFLLMADFRKAAGLSDAKPSSTVERLAKAHGVQVRTVGDFKLAALYRAVTHMSADQDRACLDAALADTEREAQHGQDVAKAWADGNLAQVHALYSGALIDQCVLATPSLKAALDRGVQEGVAAIGAVLAKPGKTVVVIDLGLLLRPDGLLDQLRAAGDEVSAPRE